jgi:hypothetical protein
MVMKLKFFILTIFFLFAYHLSAVDFDEGNIKLRINNKTGSFTLFYRTDQDTKRYEPLFYGREPNSSYLSVNVDGKIHKLGKSKEFRTIVETDGEKPSVIYQSSLLTVTEVFTPVQTFSYSSANGVKIDITLRNPGDTPVSAGLRMLIDTNLGEGWRKNPPLITNNLEITKEKIINGASDELYWISKNQNLSLMGTIVNPIDKSLSPPDYVHIANWKLLDKALWGLDYVPDRSFNYRPYLIADSAVCYYYEPKILGAGDSITFTIFLTTEDITWYNIGSDFDFSSYQASSLTEEDKDIDPDYLLLLRMQAVLNRFLSGEIFLKENDLDEIEGNINRLKTKFNLR